MRFPVALGLFLLTGGFMITVLHPVYRTGERAPQQGIEASGSVEVYRPIPDWVGPTALAAGTALLILAGLSHYRSRGDPSGWGGRTRRSR